MADLLSYLTTDPTNAEWAKTLAARWGIDLEEADPRDVVRLEREQAQVILDWDHLEGMPKREHFLNGSPVKVVAVHGHNLPSWADFLARRGIIVTSQLDDALFAAITARRKAA